MGKDNLIFLHKLLKAIADAIIIVFIPLYLLKQTEDLGLAMGYLVIYSLFVMLFMGILRVFIQKYGVLCIILHFLPIIGAEAVLNFAPINWGTVTAVAALMGLVQALYSVPLNLVFTFGDKKTNVGKFMIATNIGKLVFTLISGFILSSEIRNSFLILSIASVVFYIACVFPLFFAYKELKENYEAIHKRDLALKEKKHVPVDKWFILFHITFGLFQPVMDNVVPLFLYVNSLSFSAVTIVIVLVEALKILSNYLSQFLVKKNKSVICVILSGVIFTGSILAILFVKNSLALYILTCVCSVSFPLTFVPMFSLYCNYLRKTENVFYGMTRRDFDIFSLRPAMYALCYLGAGLYPVLICGVAVIPLMLLSEIRLIHKNRPSE